MVGSIMKKNCRKLLCISADLFVVNTALLPMLQEYTKELGFLKDCTSNGTFI
jgi:hypothetical protein